MYVTARAGWRKVASLEAHTRRHRMYAGRRPRPGATAAWTRSDRGTGTRRPELRRAIDEHYGGAGQVARPDQGTHAPQGQLAPVSDHDVRDLHGVGGVRDRQGLLGRGVLRPRIPLPDAVLL